VRAATPKPELEQEFDHKEDDVNQGFQDDHGSTVPWGDRACCYKAAGALDNVTACFFADTFDSEGRGDLLDDR
jgi:hypothetical protein